MIRKCTVNKGKVCYAELSLCLLHGYESFVIQSHPSLLVQRGDILKMETLFLINVNFPYKKEIYAPVCRASLVSSVSQNNLYAKEAHVGVAYCGLLHQTCECAALKQTF